MQVNTPSLLEWYNIWNGQPRDAAVQTPKMPTVKVNDLLRWIGVPPNKWKAICLSLTDEDLPVLRSLVLKAYANRVDELFVAQLEGFRYEPSLSKCIGASSSDPSRYIHYCCAFGCARNSACCQQAPFH